MVKMDLRSTKLLSSLALAFIFTIQTCTGTVCFGSSTEHGLYSVHGRSSVVERLWTTGAQHGGRVDVSVRNCPRGFYAQQPTRSHCENGTWTPPWPTCERPHHPCEVPLTAYYTHDAQYVLQFINGSAGRDIKDYNGATLPDGTWLVARCEDPGRYRLVGETRRLCTEGEWSAPEPTCERPRIPCDVPVTPPRSHVLQFINGSTVRDINEYESATLPDGTWLVARCEDPGRYRLVGESRRMCTEAEWSAPEPTCERVSTSITTIGIPHVVASNGTIFIYPRLYEAPNQYQYISCNLGVGVGGSANLTMPQNVRSIPKEKHRGRNWLGRGQIIREYILLNPILQEHSGNYSCSTSNTTTPSHTVEIIIKDITCPAMEAPANGRFIDRDNSWIRGHYTVAKKIYFECSAGFRLVGASHMYCTVDGWSNQNPTCIQRPRHPCHVPLSTFGIHVLQFINGSAVRDISDYNGTTLPDGTWLVARCEDPGRYRLVGESSRLCIDGKWSAPEPTCVGASATQVKTKTAPIRKTAIPMTAISTTSPPSPGSFSGTVTLNTNYEYYYEDSTAPEYTTLATNFSNAMRALYRSADTAISGLFSGTRVIQMSQNRTYVDIQFSVVVSAVQQGARDFLVGQLDPLPSTSLNTYPIIWVSIGQETAVGSGISR